VPQHKRVTEPAVPAGTVMASTWNQMAPTRQTVPVSLPYTRATLNACNTRQALIIRLNNSNSQLQHTTKCSNTTPSTVCHPAASTTQPTARPATAVHLSRVSQAATCAAAAFSAGDSLWQDICCCRAYADSHFLTPSHTPSQPHRPSPSPLPGDLTATQLLPNFWP
jgi:hypothetical protein